MSPSRLPVMFILLLFSCDVFAYKILVIVSLPLRSHYMAFQRLFRELANRGHSVTVMNNYPDENPVPNLNFINLWLDDNNSTAGYFTPLNHYENLDSSYIHLYNFYRHLELAPASTQFDCSNFFTNEAVKTHFAEQNDYDVIFVEQFVGECGLAYAGAVNSAPIIGITSHVLLPPAYTRLGIPFDFGADSFYFSDAGRNPSMYKKTEAFIMDFIYKTYHRYYLHPIIHGIFHSHLPYKLDVEKVAKERIRMMFVYQHFSLTGSRILAPQVLEIGGLHIGNSKPVPEVIEKFLSDASQGAIFFSFGSNLKSSTMSTNKLQQFLEAFTQIPQKVIWKFENASFPKEQKDIYASSWLPQLDILCHPKVVAFITHGGMLSLSEAAHCGKPVLVIPFFGDQFTNAAAARHAGLGDTLHFDRLTSDVLVTKLKELVSGEMQQNAKRISKLWHDRPISVMDSAVYWTEYVARHGTAPPPLPSQQSTWFDSLLLDVAAIIALLLLTIVTLLYAIIKIVWLLIRKLLSLIFFKNKLKMS